MTYQQEVSLVIHSLSFERANPVNQKVNIIVTVFDFQVFSNTALLSTWYSLISSHERRPKSAKQIILTANNRSGPNIIQWGFRFLIENANHLPANRLGICPSWVKAKKWNEATYDHLIGATTIWLISTYYI